MGFLRKKQKNNDTPAPAPMPDEKENIQESEPVEEDDFSPIQKKPVLERGEFLDAAKDNFMKAAGEQQESLTDSIPASDPDAPENDVSESEQTEDDVLENEPAKGAVSENEPAEDAAEAPAISDTDTEDDYLPAPVSTQPDGDDRSEDENAEQPEPVEEETVRKKSKFSLHIKKKTLKTAGIITAAVLCVFGAVYGYGCATVPKDRMGRNIYIENVNVSNMTFQEAVAAIEKTNILKDQKITLTCSGQTYSMNGADVGLTPRITETVDKAMRYGKTGNIFIDGFANTLQLVFPHKVVPSAIINEAILRDNLSVFGKQIHGELIEHTLEFGDGVVICASGRSGFDNNTDTAYNEVVKQLSNEKFSDIPVTLRKGAPKDMTVEAVDSFTYHDPVNAAYVVENNTVTVTDDAPGRFINKDEAAALAAQVKEGANPVQIPYYSSPAQITKEQLTAKLFNATLGSFSTNYGSSNANRCANIANASGKINGKVLGPGEVFSFNATVGPRSEANGFYTAKEYVNGETVDGIGGGTCQVSSTLYNAVLYSDLSIVTRTNHMFPVGYAPMGQDATVADTGVDFKFVNDTGYPVKIASSTAGRTITVSIIGTQRDDPRTVKIVNTSKPVGDDTSVHSIREVYNSAGQLIRTDDLGNSYYMAHP